MTQRRIVPPRPPEPKDLVPAADLIDFKTMTRSELAVEHAIWNAFIAAGRPTVATLADAYQRAIEAELKTRGEPL